jgi:rhodanese-related sulfurtransferase
MMDVAIPANVHIGLPQEHIASKGWTLPATEAIELAKRGKIVVVDLRELSERARHGIIPGSLHAPYNDLHQNVGPGGILLELASVAGRRNSFYCAFGERSAMAAQAAQLGGLSTVCHIEGGIDAWKKAGGPAN